MPVAIGPTSGATTFKPLSDDEQGVTLPPLGEPGIPPAPAGEFILMEDGISYILQEDGVSKILLEAA
jgi:hypothetical protein